MNKDDIRRRMKARKTMLDDNDRLKAAQSVFATLEQTADFMLADRILMYHSLPDELSTHEFIRRWSSRKHFYLPRVNGESLDILPYDESRLSPGSFHIEEPIGDDTADINDIELIVVPAVAFDRKGNRVGRGKGYYDRLLSGSTATKIGVGYDFQLIDEWNDAAPHDVRMDMVITESHRVVVNNKHEA